MIVFLDSWYRVGHRLWFIILLSLWTHLDSLASLIAVIIMPNHQIYLIILFYNHYQSKVNSHDAAAN